MDPLSSAGRPAALLLLLALACATPRAVTPEPTPAPTPSASAVPQAPAAPVAAPQQPVACPLPFRAPDAWFEGGMVLLGEMHGTVEAPQVALSFVCHAAASGRPVRLGLELPRDEQPLIDRFLEDGDRAALLTGAHWTRQYQDGRSSVAFLELIDGVRALRQQGRAIELVAFDVPFGERSEDRDAAMAAHLVEAARSRPMDTVVLVGNLHAKTSVGLPRPMGWRLAQAGLGPHPVLLEALEGEAWYCATFDAASCQVRPSGRPLDPGETGTLTVGSVPVRGYEARLVLPRFSASPPALASSSPSAASPAPRR